MHNVIKTCQGILLRRARTKTQAAELFNTFHVAWRRELKLGDLGFGCNRQSSNPSIPELKLLAVWVRNTSTPFQSTFPSLAVM